MPAVHTEALVGVVDAVGPDDVRHARVGGGVLLVLLGGLVLEVVGAAEVVLGAGAADGRELPVTVQVELDFAFAPPTVWVQVADADHAADGRDGGTPVGQVAATGVDRRSGGHERGAVAVEHRIEIDERDAVRRRIRKGGRFDAARRSSVVQAERNFTGKIVAGARILVPLEPPGRDLSVRC